MQASITALLTCSISEGGFGTGSLLCASAGTSFTLTADLSLLAEVHVVAYDAGVSAVTFFVNAANGLTFVSGALGLPATVTGAVFTGNQIDFSAALQPVTYQAGACRGLARRYQPPILPRCCHAGVSSLLGG